MSVFDYPTGSVTPFAGGAIPTGWSSCDGTSYDGTLDDYKDLWAVIGTTFGGTGQSSFKVPNLGARVPVGVKSVTSSTGLDGPIGSWTGNTNITLSDTTCGVQSHYHTLTDPGHNHTFSQTGYASHTHTFYYTNYNYVLKAAGQGGTYIAAINGNASFAGNVDGRNAGVTYGSSALNAFSISNSTAVQPTAATGHENRQPQLAVNYIIKL